MDELINDEGNTNIKEVVSDKDVVESESREEERGKRQKHLSKRFDDYVLEINYVSLDEVPKNHKEAMNSKNYTKDANRQC